MNRSLCAAMFRRWTIVPSLALAASLSLAPGTAWACACGCGVFDISTSSMFAEQLGQHIYLGYDYQDQDHRLEQAAHTTANNGDKDLPARTSLPPAVEYMFNRSWGIQVEVPSWDPRNFTTDTNFGSSPPNLVTSQSSGPRRHPHRGDLHRIFGGSVDRA